MTTGHHTRVFRGLSLFICSLFSGAALAAEAFASIIIDDLGDNLERAHDVIRLDAPVSIAVLPGTPYAARTAKLAKRHGKDVILHIPMQSIQHSELTDGALSLHMSRQQFLDQLGASLDSVPHLVGVNNHMGSLITRHPGHMRWLMDTLSQRGSLFFVDSRTTDQTVALRIADEHGVPGVERDVFLDPAFDEDTIETQFDRFIKLAREKGSALAIAHPHPNTLRLLKKRLKTLQRHGIRLVSISEYVKKRNAQHVTCTGPACAGM